MSVVVGSPYYEDTNGDKIYAGDMISIAGDEPEVVFECGINDLGVNASNEAYLKAHPEAEREYYPLSNFDMRDVLIVEKSGIGRKK